MGMTFFVVITFIVAIVGVSTPDLGPMRGDVTTVTNMAKENALLIEEAQVDVDEALTSLAVLNSYQIQVIGLANDQMMSQMSREFIKSFDIGVKGIRDGALLKVSSSPDKS